MTINHVAVGESRWGQRVGAIAARWLISAARLRIAGAVVGACGLLLIGISALLLDRDGQSQGFAVVLAFALVAIISSLSLFWTAAKLRWLGVDAAFDVLRRRIPGLTGEQMRRACRSLNQFDATLAPRMVESVKAPTEAAWIAGIPRPTLRGVSQRTLHTVAITVLVVAAIWAIVLLSVGATGHFPPQRLWERLWSVAIIILALGALIRLATAVRRVQEFRAGYSSMWAVLATRGVGAGFDARRCVDLVDSSSGMLLRGAGQEPITWRVYRDRRNEVRTRFPRAVPTRL